MSIRRRVNPAKTFLSKYRAYTVQLESLRREITRQRESLTSITAQLKGDVVQTGPAGDRMAEALARIIDSEAQLAEIAGEIALAQTEILDAVGSVRDETQKAVLMLRYIEGLDWIGVQEMIGYERTQTLVIHGRALVEVNRWLEERTKTDI